MVEIKQMADASPPQAEDGAKYRLIYAKSKVYVNPTAYARDNIPGFAAIVKRVRDPFFVSEMHYSLSNTSVSRRRSVRHICSHGSQKPF